MNPVYVADCDHPSFERDRLAVHIVCIGDSITGWNNFGPARSWPFPTYPRFLQEMCEPSGLRVADGGVAGEVSDNGLRHVRRCLGHFPNSRQFVIGFGTNDLAIWPDVEATSRRIIRNLDKMVQAVRHEGRRPYLFDVPYANESLFAAHVAKTVHNQRDDHNERLREYCQQNGVPLAEICAQLRDEHFGDELHPNEKGARIIAGEVFMMLSQVDAGA